MLSLMDKSGIQRPLCGYWRCLQLRFGAGFAAGFFESTLSSSSKKNCEGGHQSMDEYKSVNVNLHNYQKVSAPGPVEN